MWKSRKTFPGQHSQSSGASSASARSTVAAAGSGATSKRMASAASRAASRVSATTTATGSPTWRTRPMLSAGRGGTLGVEPSRFFIGTGQGMWPIPSASRSSPV